jgi:nucleotide-binding universal stress UspA family protein
MSTTSPAEQGAEATPDGGSDLPAAMAAPVVVGVDGSEGGQRALVWALREARARHASVRVLTVWNWHGLVMSPFSPYSANSRSQIAQQAAQVQAAAVAAALAEDEQAGLGPTPEVSAEVIEGDAASALVEHASDASMLVVGAYGHGRLHRTLLGSVAEVCSRHAGCPVVVVPVHTQMVLPQDAAAVTHEPAPPAADTPEAPQS